jgi:hypothetical protein
MSNPVGPVCHIPPANTPGNPGPLAIPGMPAPATASIPSLQATVNQLREIIITILGQQGAQGAAGQSAKPSDFVQKNIKTTTKKIYQNNDPSTGNFVEVQVVQSLTMANKTGSTWTYNAPPANNNG